MKQTIRTVALFLVLGTMAAGCQKEYSLQEASVQIAANVAANHSVSYSVDGTNARAILCDNNAWTEFLVRMFALAEEGHTVTFVDETLSAQCPATKETVTYTSTDKGDAYAWSEKMALAGYYVTVTYDEQKKEYTCIAFRQ